MRRLWCVACLAVCALLAGAVFLQLRDPDLSQRIAKRLGLEVRQSAPTRYYRDMVWLQGQTDSQVPGNAVLFIGDSITQGLFVSRVAACGVNYGVAGDTTDGVLRRLQVYGSLGSAGAVILAIGVNDLKYRTNDEIVANYRHILAAIPVRVPIIFSAIHPVDDELRGSDWNRRIIELNSAARGLCEMRENCLYSSVHDVLANNDGELSDSYHIGDGLHLSSSGYSVWSSELARQLKNIDSGFLAGGTAACVYGRQGE